MGNCVSACNSCSSSSSSCACICKVSSHIMSSTDFTHNAGADQLGSKAAKLVKTIMVVHSVEQRVMELGGGAPMNVAELMLEFPGHFVAQYETDIATLITNISNPAATVDNSATSTNILKRATPLPADHEASPGHIYILLPMHKLHTRFAPHEYASFMALLRSYVQCKAPSTASSRKKSLHSLMQTTSAKVTPLSSLQLEEIPAHLTASHQPALGSTDGAGAEGELDDDIIDSLLQQFCSSQLSAAASAGNGFSKSGSLVRSKSWIPKLETINESSVLVV